MVEPLTAQSLLKRSLLLQVGQDMSFLLKAYVIHTSHVART